MIADFRSPALEPGSPDGLLAWLCRRYDDLDPAPIGHRAWRELLEGLRAFVGREAAEAYAATGELQEDFDWFLSRCSQDLHVQQSIVAGRPSPGRQRLFVSHRHGDTGVAERVACIADEHGYRHWLEMHDPPLAALDRLQGRLPETLRGILIAATIEMAVLNCSHAIMLFGQDAAGSEWIPYGFGRAKRLPFLWTPSAASWVAQCARPPGCAHLATMLGSEAELRRWLEPRSASRSCLASMAADS